MKGKTQARQLADWFLETRRKVDAEELSIERYGTTEKTQQMRNMLQQVGRILNDEDSVSFGVVQRERGKLAKYGIIDTNKIAMKYGKRQVKHMNNKTKLASGRIELIIDQHPMTASMLIDDCSKGFELYNKLAAELMATASKMAAQVAAKDSKQLK